jgi:PII-like signaling protein
VLSSGPAKKVSIYVREDQKYHGHATYSAILDFLFYRSIAGATVIHGVAGFGADHQLHTTRLVDVLESMPVKVEFIETAETVDELMPKLYEMAGAGLIEVQDTNVVKPARAAKPPEAVAARKVEGQAKLMRIFISEGDRWGDRPLYEALIEAFRANDIAGATVFAGIMGYGPRGRIYQEKMLELSPNRPMMLSAIDTEEKLRGLTPLLDKMIKDGMVIMSDADVMKYTHDYVEAERRQEARQ